MITTEDYLRSLINDRNKIINKIEAHGDSVPSNPTFGELANIYNNTSLLPYDYSPRALFSPNVETIYTVEPQVYLYTKFTNNLSGFYSGLYGGNVQNMDASNAVAGVNAFRAVSSLNLNGANFNNMINIDGMFANTGGNAFINNIKFGNVITASNLFSNSNISTIDVNLSNLQNAASMFENCANLTSVTGNIGDSGSLTDMAHMYFGCNNLQNIPDVIIRSNITNLQYVLRVQDNREDKIPAKFNLDIITNSLSAHYFVDCFAGSNVLRVNNLIITNTYQSGAGSYAILNNCPLLTDVYNVDLPKKFTSDSASPYYNLFTYSNNIRNIININVTGVEYVSGMFDGLRNLQNMQIIGDFSNVINAKHTFQDTMLLNSPTFWTNGNFNFCQDLSNVVEAEFMFCRSGLYGQNANYANYFTFNNVINAQGMFLGAWISGVDMGNSPIVNAERMFSGAKNLVYVNLNGDLITNAHTMFSNTKKLQILNNLSFPNLINASNMFENSIDPNVPGENKSVYIHMPKVTNLCYTFLNSGLNGNITINCSLLAREKLAGVFAECHHITNIDVEGQYWDGSFGWNLYNVVHINANMKLSGFRLTFKGYQHLVKIPNVIEYNSYSVMFDELCADCRNLTDFPLFNIQMNPGGTSSTPMFNRAFANCSNLSNSAIINILTMFSNITVPGMGMSLNSDNYQSVFAGTGINVLNCGVPEEVLSALNSTGWTY